MSFLKSSSRPILLQRFVVVAIVAAGASVEANWPAFRGERASGIAESTLATSWNAASGIGIRWRTPIAGLSHASPIVWEKRVYVLSAVSPGGVLDTKVEGVVFAKDTIEHEWRLHCLDATSGRELWMRVLHKGTPRQPRHVKGTYANATPATDGTHIAVMLGNEGLFVTDMDGRLRWRKEMAPAQPDWSLDAASSPLIVGDLVVVQNDWQRGGFVAAYRLADGDERWRVPRSEGLSWSTPGVWSAPLGGTQVVLNSPRWIRAHDPRDGRELWRLNNSTDGPYDRVPTPVAAGDLMLVAGGGGHRPIFAVRPSATGDITPNADGSRGRDCLGQRPCLALPADTARAPRLRLRLRQRRRALRLPFGGRIDGVSRAGRAGCWRLLRVAHRRCGTRLSVERGWRRLCRRCR